MADERIYLPGWVKPSVALALALLGAGATAGWVGANYARNTDTQLQEIRTSIRDTQRELCNIRTALNVTSYTTICEERRQLSALSVGGIVPAAMVTLQDPVDAISAPAIVSILAGLSVGLFILGAAGFLICWLEILRLRKRQHDTDSHITALQLESDLKKMGTR